MMGAEMASRDNVLLVFVLSLLVVYSSTIPVKVADVKGYTKLRSRGDSPRRLQIWWVWLVNAN